MKQSVNASRLQLCLPPSSSCCSHSVREHTRILSRWPAAWQTWCHARRYCCCAKQRLGIVIGANEQEWGEYLDLLFSDFQATDPQQVRSGIWRMCVPATWLQTHLPVNNVFNLMSQPIGKTHIDVPQNTPPRGLRLQRADKEHFEKLNLTFVDAWLLINYLRPSPLPALKKWSIRNPSEDL